MAAAGILSHSLAQAGSITRPMSAAAPNANGSGNAAGSSAGISANDFLTLLVTEMQNQDPTAATDPNEYINQLVQVNSLEQLISINQTLTGALGATASDSKSSGGATKEVSKSDLPLPVPAFPSEANLDPQDPARVVSGNLGVPAENAAAERVAHALGAGATAVPPAPAARR